MAARRAAAIETDRVRGFDESPLEVAVDVWAGRPEARFPTAGVDARCRARISGQLLGGGEPCDIADLERDHHGEREAHAGQGKEVLNRRRRLEQGPDLLLELAYLVIQLLDLLEKVPGGVRRTGWQKLETLPHEGAAACAEDVAHLEVMEGVLGQGRVNAILELGALADEHHPRPRQIALVAQLARGNPDGWECAGALELIEPSDVEFIGLVDLAHHEFGLAGVHEPGDTTGGLDLVDDPIPIANGLDRHRGAGLTSLEKLLECAALVRDALFADELAVGPGHRRQRVVLVGIERDIFHLLRLPRGQRPPSVVQRTR